MVAESKGCSSVAVGLQAAAFADELAGLLVGHPGVVHTRCIWRESLEQTRQCSDFAVTDIT